MPFSTPATRQLEAQTIPYHLLAHTAPVHSIERAAGEGGLAPGQMVRSLVFRLQNREFVLVLMPGTGRVSWARLRQHLGVSRITTATREQVLAPTGYPPVTLTPFGLLHPLRILADQGILAFDGLSVGAAHLSPRSDSPRPRSASKTETAELGSARRRSGLSICRRATPAIGRT
ncbi:MAG: YbaK/EbsC family protein [Anaerolineales bacterium]|nr:YbaK/EbsC family protein [Anaerolineales bacterium]